MATDGGYEGLPTEAGDVAPGLAEPDGGRSPRTTDDGEPLPRVPPVPADEKPAVGVPPTAGGQTHATDPGAKPIRFYRGQPTTTDACDCGTECACTTESAGREQSSGADPSADSPAVASDGGATPANVNPDGELGELSFTPPAEGVSQRLEDGTEDPTERPNPPDGVDVDTPGYGIRSEMNEIETPDDKTWFFELDEAVIAADRCIQCGTCVAACPSDSIGIGEDDLPKLVKMCTGCSLCWDFCPRGGLRYERQWKITGGEDNVSGAGDPITEFSAKVTDDWRKNAQDGGLVTSVLIHLLEAGEIDGALIATESEEETWKAESYLATTPEECIENAGSFYNQTMALGNLDISRWEDKLDVPLEEASLALVGTPCEIEGIRAIQDFDWDYAAQEAGVRAIEYTIALMCTKNFNYWRLFGDLLEDERGVDREDVGRMDVLDGKMMVWDRAGEMIVEEDVEHFHDAALKGCDECADFTGYCADLTVGSVGSSDEYSSVIIRTDRGLKAWELTEPDLDYHDLEDRSAIGGLQSWDKKKAFESLERPFDPDAPRFIDYTDHVENYGTQLNPHRSDH